MKAETIKIFGEYESVDGMRHEFDGLHIPYDEIRGFVIFDEVTKLKTFSDEFWKYAEKKIKEAYPDAVEFPHLRYQIIDEDESTVS